MSVCAGPVDAAWEALASELHFLKQLLPDPPAAAVSRAQSLEQSAGAEKPVACFERLLIAPGGYQSAINTGMLPRKKCPVAAGVLDFGSTMRARLGVQQSQQPACTGRHLKVLFVRRENYKAHPRQRGAIVQRLANEAEVYAALLATASTLQMQHPGVTVSVVSGKFSRMSLRQQMQHAHDACVIVGAHGAGLSHVLFARQGVHVLEVVTPGFSRPHFRAFALWAGAHYTAVKVKTSSPEPRLITDHVRDILSAKAHATVASNTTTGARTI